MSDTTILMLKGAGIIIAAAMVMFALLLWSIRRDADGKEKIRLTKKRLMVTSIDGEIRFVFVTRPDENGVYPFEEFCIKREKQHKGMDTWFVSSPFEFDTSNTYKDWIAGYACVGDIIYDVTPIRAVK